MQPPCSYNRGLTYGDDREGGSQEMLLKTSLFIRSVVSDSLRPHGPQHARPPCPSHHLPGVRPSPCPLNW